MRLPSLRKHFGIARESRGCPKHNRLRQQSPVNSYDTLAQSAVLIRRLPSASHLYARSPHHQCGRLRSHAWRQSRHRRAARRRRRHLGHAHGQRPRIRRRRRPRPRATLTRHRLPHRPRRRHACLRSRHDPHTPRSRTAAPFATHSATSRSAFFAAPSARTTSSARPSRRSKSSNAPASNSRTSTRTNTHTCYRASPDPSFAHSIDSGIRAIRNPFEPRWAAHTRRQHAAQSLRPRLRTWSPPLPRFAVHRVAPYPHHRRHHRRLGHRPSQQHHPRGSAPRHARRHLGARLPSRLQRPRPRCRHHAPARRTRDRTPGPAPAFEKSSSIPREPIRASNSSITESWIA